MAFERPSGGGSVVERATDAVAIALYRARHRGRRGSAPDERVDGAAPGPAPHAFSGDGFGSGASGGDDEADDEEPWRPAGRGVGRRGVGRRGVGRRGMGRRSFVRSFLLVVVGLAAGGGMVLLLRPPVVKPTGSNGVSGPTVAPLAELPLITAAVAPTTPPAPTTTFLITVHAAGAFRRPGVYLFPLGARVDDLLSAAGGVAADAEMEVLNLAAPLSDGQRVWVPVRGHPIPSIAPAEIADPVSTPAGVGGSGGGSGPSATGPNVVLDLNTVTVEQLDALPGVGPATAAAIVEYRTLHKRFASVGELLNVRGIGEAKLSALKNRVKV